MRKIEPLHRVWVGLVDREIEGQYKWVDGRMLSQEQMALYRSDAPQDSGGEDCTVVANGDNKLNDGKCSDKYRFICEIAVE